MHQLLKRNRHFIVHYFCSCVHQWLVFVEINMSNGNAHLRRHPEGIVLKLDSSFNVLMFSLLHYATLVWINLIYSLHIYFFSIAYILFYACVVVAKVWRFSVASYRALILITQVSPQNAMELTNLLDLEVVSRLNLVAYSALRVGQIYYLAMVCHSIIYLFQI